MNINKKYTLGIFYGTDQEVEQLTKRFVGHLLNNDEFCKACEDLEQKIKCDHCREHLRNYGDSIYFFEKIGQNVPDFIEEPEIYLPQNIPPVDFLLVVGIHQDLLSGLPAYLKDKSVKAVVIPIEDPKWVPAGLQVQVLKEFETYGIQSAFPKPFCSLSKDENEYNRTGFHVSNDRNFIDEFIDYFQIGMPIASLLLNRDGNVIQDSCVLQCAPCGSTYYVVQQLKSKYLENKEISLNERISKAHHAFPCSASMDQDLILKDSILHVGGYLVRNAIRKELNLEVESLKEVKSVVR